MITDKIIKTYVNKKANLSDWNGGWRLLENKGQFSACDVSLTKPSLSNGKAMTLRPRRATFSRSMKTSRPWDCGYSSHRRPFGTAVTRPTEDLLGLRLLVPPKTFWDCGYSSHRRPFGTSSTLARRVRRRLSASPWKASIQSGNHGP